MTQEYEDTDAYSTSCSVLFPNQVRIPPWISYQDISVAFRSSAVLSPELVFLESLALYPLPGRYIQACDCDDLVDLAV
ncbi:uncharacterized protein TrAFT101_003094 [Trichoderma asperellum]|uniref:uncharacterized protein n=1 Tax=Trichoderma asperellum TaxID=101201 RepID=UPI0033181951|nr:hypothetical protein TrAFT101_003094 [Trichoderma asperellum]